MTHDEMIEVIQAHKEGKAIERDDLLCVGTEWERMPRDGKFNFATFRYRVKPEPFECWAIVGKGDVVRSYHSKYEYLPSRVGPNERIVRLVEVQD